MPAPRRLRGIDAIRDATVHAAPSIHVLILDDVPRTGLTIREVSQITGLPNWRIRTEIANGRIRVITGGAAHIIPVSELGVIASWAEHLNPAG